VSLMFRGLQRPSGNTLVQSGGKRRYWAPNYPVEDKGLEGEVGLASFQGVETLASCSCLWGLAVVSASEAACRRLIVLPQRNRCSVLTSAD
jgi:hypothetical protein